MKNKKLILNVDELRASFVKFITYHIVNKISKYFHSKPEEYINAPKAYFKMVSEFGDKHIALPKEKKNSIAANISVYNSCGLNHKVISSFLGTFEGKRISHSILDKALASKDIIIRNGHGGAISFDSCIHTLDTHYSIPDEKLISIFKNKALLSSILSFGDHELSGIDTSYYSKFDINNMSKAYKALDKLNSKRRETPKKKFVSKYKFNLNGTLYTRQIAWLNEHFKKFAILKCMSRAEYKFMAGQLGLEYDDNIEFSSLDSPTEKGIAFQALVLKSLKTKSFMANDLLPNLQSFIQLNLCEEHYLSEYAEKLLKKIETITDENCKACREIIFKRGNR